MKTISLQDALKKRIADIKPGEATPERADAFEKEMSKHIDDLRKVDFKGRKKPHR